MLSGSVVCVQVMWCVFRWCGVCPDSGVCPGSALCVQVVPCASR